MRELDRDVRINRIMMMFKLNLSKSFISLIIASIVSILFLTSSFAFGIKESDKVTIGSIIKFGEYDWRVLDIQESRILLLSELVLEERKYHEYPVAVTWERSSLRKYLNSEFIDNFTDEEKEAILEIQVVNNDNPWFGTSGGNDTIDKIFLLSIEEVVQYFGDSGKLSQVQNFHDGQFRSGAENYKSYIDDQYNIERIAIYSNSEPADWSLRSSGRDARNFAVVSLDGFIVVSGALYNSSGLIEILNDEYNGVRPAIWVNLGSLEKIMQEVTTTEEYEFKFSWKVILILAFSVALVSIILFFIISKFSRKLPNYNKTAYMQKYMKQSKLHENDKKNLKKVIGLYTLINMRCKDTKEAILDCKLFCSYDGADKYNKAALPIVDLQKYSDALVSGLISQMYTYDKILFDTDKANLGAELLEDDYKKKEKEKEEAITETIKVFENFVLVLNKTLIEISKLGETDVKKAKDIIDELNKVVEGLKSIY